MNKNLYTPKHIEINLGSFEPSVCMRSEGYSSCLVFLSVLEKHSDGFTVHPGDPVITSMQISAS